MRGLPLVSLAHAEDSAGAFPELPKFHFWAPVSIFFLFLFFVEKMETRQKIETFHFFDGFYFFAEKWKPLKKWKHG